MEAEAATAAVGLDGRVPLQHLVVWLVVYNSICFVMRTPDCKLLKDGELVF